jgi:flagellar biosynthesis protein
VVAKGKGRVAENIIALAHNHHIPLYEDPNLSAVLETLDLDTHIPPEMYRAVAEVLAFVYRVNHKMR